MTVEQWIAPYRDASVIVDTNILVVYVTGMVDPAIIGKTKRTKAYIPEDYKTLTSILSIFRERIAFPNVFTEVSNLIEKSDPQLKYRLFQKLEHVAGLFSEHYCPTRSVTLTKDPNILGVTDEVILASVDKGFVLLSDDFDLGNRYQSLSGRRINFSEVRDSYL